MSESLAIPLPEEEATTVALSFPPFVVVEGVINIRDFGGYATADPAVIVKSSHLFRSGDPSRITERGVKQLHELGIRKVFDLRADVEIAKYNSANLGIEGVEFVRAPILDEAFDPVGVAERLKSFATSEAEAFLKLYGQILQTGGPALETVLVHLRDHPNEACLIHCTDET
ncbi:hypothetical protein AcV5_006617 [Taiwanofungus camphoratus]|nr:hypothetical protein AcV5_006617 [Antrodia cinnamomea]